MSESLAGLEPAELWRHFGALAGIPRPSGQENAAREYVKSLASERGAGWRQDEKGNLVVFLDDGEGPVVAVQAHLDMVCEKNPDVEHDFSADPIQLVREGDSLRAQGTTLGADNGIGAAAALALLTSEGIERGPLELVFTVEEETGLHGALTMDTSLLQSELMINLDSEDPDELTVGCAGGATVELRPALKWEPVPEGWVGRELVLSGLQGGHSGIEIHRPLGNAIKLLASAAGGLRSALQMRLGGLEAGRAHNVIPREARAILAVPAQATSGLEQAVSGIASALAADWQDSEPGLDLKVPEAPAPGQVLDPSSEDAVFQVLSEMPHGVIEMSEDFPGKVDTSANLAQVRISPTESIVVGSARSMSAHKLFTTRTAMSRAGLKARAIPKVVDSYPGWEPDLDSPLLEIAKGQYEAVNGKPASVQIVHGGLECGVLVAKKEALQAISFGPLITGAHSPQERVEIATVDSMWRLLVGLLGALSKLETAQG